MEKVLLGQQQKQPYSPTPELTKQSIPIILPPSRPTIPKQVPPNNPFVPRLNPPATSNPKTNILVREFNIPTSQELGIDPELKKLGVTVQITNLPDYKLTYKGDQVINAVGTERQIKKFYLSALPLVNQEELFSIVLQNGKPHYAIVQRKIIAEGVKFDLADSSSRLIFKALQSNFPLITCDLYQKAVSNSTVRPIGQSDLNPTSLYHMRCDLTEENQNRNDTLAWLRKGFMEESYQGFKITFETKKNATGHSIRHTNNLDNRGYKFLGWDSNPIDFPKTSKVYSATLRNTATAANGLLDGETSISLIHTDLSFLRRSSTYPDFFPKPSAKVEESISFSLNHRFNQAHKVLPTTRTFSFKRVNSIPVTPDLTDLRFENLINTLRINYTGSHDQVNMFQNSDQVIEGLGLAPDSIYKAELVAQIVPVNSSHKNQLLLHPEKISCTLPKATWAQGQPFFEELIIARKENSQQKVRIGVIPTPLSGKAEAEMRLEKGQADFNISVSIVPEGAKQENRIEVPESIFRNSFERLTKRWHSISELRDELRGNLSDGLVWSGRQHSDIAPELGNVLNMVANTNDETPNE